MTAISWASGTSGDWATSADWSTDSTPRSADDATIAASGTYTVTVLQAEFAHSLTLGAIGATLSVTSGLTVGTTLDAAAGTLSLASGGSLNGGTVAAAGAAFAFAGGTLNGVTWQGPLTVSSSATSVTMTGADTLIGAGGSGAGSLTVSGQGAILTITGTLVDTGSLTVNAGAIQIQNGGTGTIEAASTNTGTVGIHDNATLTVAGGFSNGATLDVDSNDNALEDTGEGGSSLTVTGTLANTGVVQIGDPVLALDAATTVTLGGLTNAGTSDSSTLDGSSEYAATLRFTSPTGFTSNGGTFELTYGGLLALGSSFTNTGTFGIHDSTTLTVAGGFSNSGVLDVDSNDSFFQDTGEGGSSLTVTGTLTNTGVVQIGDPILALDATTAVTLGGLANTGTSDSFILDGSSKYAATLGFTSLTGFTSNGGTFELTYGGLLALGSSFTNTGTFGIHDNTTLTVAGGFSNSGMLDVDSIGSFYAGTGEGGSSLTVTGTLANTGVVQIGDPYLALDAATAVTLGGLANTGTSDSFILDGSSKYIATLGITSPTGFTSNGGTFELTYGGLLALGSSFTNTGTFGIHDNTTLTVAGGFSNSAMLDVDSNDNASYGTGEGGSSLTVTGTLANTGVVQIGDPILALDAATTVTLGGLTNAGRSDSFILDGSSKYAATLGFTSPAGFTSNAGTFELTYGGLLALGSSFTNTGTFGIHDNTTLTVAGGFSNSATLDIDNNDNPFQGTAEGGSSLTVTGTLANAGVVQLGDPMLLLDAATSVTLGGLANTGTIAAFGHAATLMAGVTIAGSATNAGIINVGSYAALDVTGGNNYVQTAGTTTVNGSLTAASIDINGGTLVANNGGSVVVGGNLYIATGTSASSGLLEVGGAGAVVDNGGLIIVGGTGTGWLDIRSGGVVDAGAGAVDIGSLGSVIGAGMVEAAVVNNGEITGAGGTLELTGSVSSTGGFTLATGSTLRLDATVGSGQSFTFSSGVPEDLILGTPGTGLTDAIQGLATGDRIEFGNGMTITSASVVNGNTIAVDFTAGGSSGVYDLTNVSFAAGSGHQFSVGVDSSTGDSYVQVVLAVIATNGTTTLVQVGNTFELNPSGGGTGPLLEYQGSVVTAAEFGATVTAVGAVQTATGYQVVWSLGANEYVVWNTDANGDYTSSATGILSGGSYALEDLELSFGEDLNDDGTVGPTTTAIASNGVTRLVQVANQYALENGGGGIVAWASYQGNAVTAGAFGATVTPVGAQQTADGYEVVWSLGANEFIVWNTDLDGNYTSSATGIVSGNSSTLEAVEANFGDGVFSGAGPIASATTIATIGTTTLVQVGNRFELNPAGGTGPLLEYQGSFVTAGEFGATVTPVGAKQTGNGYEVSWSLGTNEFVVWDTDFNGNYTSSATGIVSGTSTTLEAVEANFGDGVFSGAGPIASTTTLATNGTTTLAQVGNLRELNPASGGTGPLLEYRASFVTAGEFGTSVTPVGAVQTASGYEVAWSLGPNGYVVWNTDSNGNYTSSATGIVSGTSYALEEFELSFGEDLNGDGTIGPSTTLIASNGATRLVQVANQYALENSSGGILAWVSYQRSAVTAGQFGATIAPVGAVQTASAYRVAWSLGANEYVVWNTDSTGNYTSSATGIVSGTSPTLEAVEANFGDGVFSGAGPIASTTTIASNGTTTLVQVGNLFELNPTGGGTVPLLEYQGSVVTAGQFGATVTPVGARQTWNGYEVVWSLGTNEYVVWNTDLNGNYVSSATGIVSGSSSTLEAVEANFGAGVFSGAGPIASTTTIATNGTTALVQVGNLFELNPASGGTGPLLEYQGGFVAAGEFGVAVTPVGAKQTGDGYEVAWSLGPNEFVVWDTDFNGNYTNSATGIVSGSSPTLEAVEANFGDGVLPGAGPVASTTTLATNGTTTLVQAGNLFELNPASGTGPLLEYQGSFVTAGEFGAAVTPVGAVQTASGYEVAWSLSANEYIVWNTDSYGNYTNSATGVVSGESFALEDLEPAFGEDLNGDGRLSAVLVTSRGAGDTVDLTGQTQATTINLGGNTASADAGLNAPSLAFIGTPDAITLGSSADTIEYSLEPSSGIETIADFVLGQDELNIDLMGTAASTLQLYNTTVGGVYAIAIASSADPTHGLVLLNMPTGDRATDLLASHVTFSDGHALIS